MDTHCIENFFTVLVFFWATCACPKKQSLPWNFSLYWIYFLHSGFLSNLRLPWKTECVLKFFTVLKYFLSFRIFEQLAFVLKNRVRPDIFHWIEYTFHIQDFWATCACPEKNRVALKIFTVLNILFPFRIFEQLVLALETEFALKFFTVLNILFTFRIFEQLALALKNRVALTFFTVLCILFPFRIFEQLALALKTEFALKFFKPVGWRPLPPTPASYAYDHTLDPTTLRWETRKNFSFIELKVELNWHLKLFYYWYISMCFDCTFVSFLSFCHEINSSAIYRIIISLMIPA